MPKRSSFHALIRVAIRRSIRAADWDVGEKHILLTTERWRRGAIECEKGMTQNYFSRYYEGPKGIMEYSVRIYWRFVSIFGRNWTPRMGYPLGKKPPLFTAKRKIIPGQLSLFSVKDK